MDTVQDVMASRMPVRARRGGVRALAITGVLALVAACGGGDDPDPSASGGAGTGADSVQVTLTETSVVLGNPDAEQRVHVYQDLNCPHCQVLHGLMGPDVERWSAGEDVAVEVTVVDYLGPRTSHGFSTRGAQLLALVAEADPAAWPAVQDALLERQPPTTTAEVTDEDLLAAAAGADIGEVDAADLAEYGPFVARATAEAAAAGVNFIPQVFVDGELVGGSSHEETVELVRAALGE